MAQLFFNDEWVKTVSLDKFTDHCISENYGMNDVDIAGYWNKVNPTIAAPKKQKPDASFGKITGITDNSGQPDSNSRNDSTGK